MLGVHIAVRLNQENDNCQQAADDQRNEGVRNGTTHVGRRAISANVRVGLTITPVIRPNEPVSGWLVGLRFGRG